MGIATNLFRRYSLVFFMRLIIAFPSFLLLFLLGITAFAQETSAKVGGAENKNLSVCFTPGADCTAGVIQEIQNSKHSIFVQAFSFTSSRLAKALIEAQERKVKVEVIFDRENAEEQFTPADLFRKKGFAVWLDGEHQSAHNKVMILDEKTVVTGSFNFTKAAQEKNAENVLVLRDKQLADLYLKNWREHQSHSKVYSLGPAKPDPR